MYIEVKEVLSTNTTKNNKIIKKVLTTDLNVVDIMENGTPFKNGSKLTLQPSKDVLYFVKDSPQN